MLCINQGCYPALCSCQVQTTGKKNQTFSKNFHNSNSYCHIWIQHEKYIEMSTKKPSIGSVVFEMALEVMRKYSKLSTKITASM